jgi:hypothetical protein
VTEVADEPVSTRRWPGLRQALLDWRYLASLAATFLAVSVVIAQGFTIPALNRVLNRLDARSEAAECIDLNQAEFNRRVVQLIDAGFDDAEARRQLAEVTSEDTVQLCYSIERDS